MSLGKDTAICTSMYEEHLTQQTWKTQTSKKIRLFSLFETLFSSGKQQNDIFSSKGDIHVLIFYCIIYIPAHQ